MTQRLEDLPRPFYHLLTAVAYGWFFLKMLPAAALAALLGFLPRRLMRSGLPHRLRGTSGLLLAAVLWDLPALALSAWAGGVWGYAMLYAAKGRNLGRCMGAAGYLFGRILSVTWKHDKEE